MTRKAALLFFVKRKFDILGHASGRYFGMWERQRCFWVQRGVSEISRRFFLSSVLLQYSILSFWHKRNSLNKAIHVARDVAYGGSINGVRLEDSE